MRSLRPFAFLYTIVWMLAVLAPFSMAHAQATTPASGAAPQAAAASPDADAAVTMHRYRIEPTSGASLAVNCKVDDKFKGWRRTMMYDSTSGLPNALDEAFNKAGLTFGMAPGLPDYQLNVTLLGIKMGTACTSCPATVVVDRELKQLATSKVIFQGTSEIKRKGSGSVNGGTRAQKSFQAALDGAAEELVEQVRSALAQTAHP